MYTAFLQQIPRLLTVRLVRLTNWVRLLFETGVYFVGKPAGSTDSWIRYMQVIQLGLTDAGISTHSLSVLLSVVEMSPRTRTAVEQQCQGYHSLAKRGHGRYTLLCAQKRVWADICNIAAFYHKKAPMLTLSQPTTGYCTPTHLPVQANSILVAASLKHVWLHISRQVAF